MMEPYNFEINIFWNFSHNKNYTELCLEISFPEKHHSTLSKQLTNILIKSSITKTFKSVKIKLIVIKNCRIEDKAC